jgi:hypothetical protein
MDHRPVARVKNTLKRQSNGKVIVKVADLGNAINSLNLVN